MKNTSKKLLAMLMALLMSITCLVSPTMASPAEPADFGTVDAVVEPDGSVTLTGDDTDRFEQVEIVVQLSGDTTYVQTGDLQLAAEGVDAQAVAYAQAEHSIEEMLNQTIEVEDRFYLLLNGFGFTGERWMVDAINELDGMTAFVSPVFQLADDADVELTPSMNTSTGTIGAKTAWDLGYTGEGMVISIIDTGITPTHEAFSVEPKGGRLTEEYLQEVFDTYGDKIHAGNGIYQKEMYRSGKLAFNWDYFEGDAIVDHSSNDHGTHVAGIAAGNNGSDFKGVAPDAQLVVMQVFNYGGGASFLDILKALEDSVYLGVDAVNMSLGAISGWSSYESVGIATLATVYEALENAGISIAAASGNDYNAAINTNFGPGKTVQRSLSANPDSGVIGNPGSLYGSFAVASCENSGSMAVINAYGENLSYKNVSGQPTFMALSGEYDIVYVGLGSVEEIADATGGSGDLTGKIALTQRGTLTFAEKYNNVANAGAVGVMLYNNSNSVLNPSGSSPIPLAVLTLAQGEQLKSHFADGVNGKCTVSSGVNYLSFAMAPSSSWGPTADLRLTPEITAPGGTIRSAIGFGSDDSYGNKSGTSMATPHVAGGLAVIKERLRTLLPDATTKEINELAYSFAMSTAHQIGGLVRQQGAGLMDVYAAVTSEVYLSVENNSRPKLELDDSEDGTFTFSVTLNNLGDTERTYTVDYSAITENVTEILYAGSIYLTVPETTIKVFDTTVKDVKTMTTLDGQDTVTVKPNGTATVTFTLNCNKELLNWCEENCPSGMFLEGFVRFAEVTKGEENPVDLSIPYLGFVGDWDYPSMLDRSYYWYDDFGTENLGYQQYSACTENYVGFSNKQGLGLNPYADMKGQTYSADRNAISPNGDGVLDAVTYIEFALLRNPKTVKLNLEDKDGNVLATLYNAQYAFSRDLYNSCCSMLLDYTAEELAENETAYLVLETWLDHAEYRPEDNESGRWVIPITKDLTAPAIRVVEDGLEIIDANYTAYYAIYADEERTELLYETGVFAGERGVAELYACDPNATYYVVTADYAGNEAVYLVEGQEVYTFAGGFTQYGKTIYGRRTKDYYEGVFNFEWVSFQAGLTEKVTDVTYTEGPGFPEGANDPGTVFDRGVSTPVDYMTTAVGRDGTLYACGLDAIYTLDPVTFETELYRELQLEVNPWGYKIWARGICVDPGTGKWYCYTGNSTNATFCSIDIETGAVTPLWQFPDWSNEGLVGIWAMTFIDDGKLLVADSSRNNLGVVSLEGELLELYEFPYDDNLTGWGWFGSLVYDKDTNCAYHSTDWGRTALGHESNGALVTFDLDTMTRTTDIIGNYGGQVVYALFVEGSNKPSWGGVEDLINAIADAETDEELLRAVEAARKGYDALHPEDKEKVSNYQKLLDAEFECCVILSQQYADNAKQSAEAAQKSYEGAQASAEEAKTAAEAAQKAYEEALNDLTENMDAADKAGVAAEEARKAYEEAQAQADTAKQESEKATAKSDEAQKAADKAKTEADRETAMEALKTAQVASEEAEAAAEQAAIAAEAVKTATETAKAAQTYAEAQALAQSAQLCATLAQQAVEVAKAKAEEAAKNAEVIEEAREAAESAQEAAETAETVAATAVQAAATAAAAADEADKTAAETAEQVAFKAREDAWAAALTAAKGCAQTEIWVLTMNTEDYVEHQLEDLAVAVANVRKAIEVSGSVDEVEFVVREFKTTMEAIAASCPVKTFTDVSTKAWYHGAVDYVVLAGLMEGRGNGEFAPEAKLTRAELVIVLYRMAGKPSVEGLDTPFTDVGDDIWYTDAIIWAYHAGVVEGMSETTFAPNLSITREQAATILYRYSGAEAVEEDALKNYTDAGKVSPWAADAMAWAVSVGLINGMTETTLVPQGNAIRAQIATILMRYCEA